MGKHPRNLDKSICGRLPIRYNRNCYYVNEKMRFMPKNGYTKLFTNMIKNENSLNIPSFLLKSKILIIKKMESKYSHGW